MRILATAIMAALSVSAAIAQDAAVPAPAASDPQSAAPAPGSVSKTVVVSVEEPAAAPGGDVPVLAVPDDSLIERQSRIGEDALILEREIEMVNKLNELISRVGFDAALEMWPEMAHRFRSSPMVLESQIRTVQLARDLEVELAGGPDAVKAAEERAAAEAASANAGWTGANPYAGAGGTGLMGPVNAPLAPGAVGVDDNGQPIGPDGQPVETIEAMIDRKVNEQLAMQAAEAPPEPESVSLSYAVSEIFGVNGEMNAIIIARGDGEDRRVKAFAGDKLPGGEDVIRIGSDGVVIRDAEGAEVTIPVR